MRIVFLIHFMQIVEDLNAQNVENQCFYVIIRKQIQNFFIIVKKMKQQKNVI